MNDVNLIVQTFYFKRTQTEQLLRQIFEGNEKNNLLAYR